MTVPEARADVVYALGNGSRWGDNEELRYSLRALERNFADLGAVVIVGMRPAWLSAAAIHVPAVDRPAGGERGRGGKDANIIAKLLLACERHVTSAWFVRSSDDELFLRPTASDEMRAYHHGMLGAERGAATSAWLRRLRRTGRYLRERTTDDAQALRFFDCHAPVRMHRARFVELMRRSPYRSGSGLAVDSYYFNCDRAAPRAPLHGEVVRLLAEVDSAAELTALTACARYLNYGDRALNPTLKHWLASTFDRPSRFEA